jgi:hypothetical protein
MANFQRGIHFMLWAVEPFIYPTSFLILLHLMLTTPSYNTLNWQYKGMERKNYWDSLYALIQHLYQLYSWYHLFLIVSMHFIGFILGKQSHVWHRLHKYNHIFQTNDPHLIAEKRPSPKKSGFWAHLLKHILGIIE